MAVYDCLVVLHAAVTHFNLIFVEYLVKGVVFFENEYFRKNKEFVIFFHFEERKNFKYPL